MSLTDGILSSFLKRDLTVYHTLSFDVLMSTYIPQVVKAYSNVTTLLDGVRYSLTIKDVVCKRADHSDAQCFDYGLSRTVSVTGTVTLEKVKMVNAGDANSTLLTPEGKHSQLSSVRLVIAKIPVCTGRLRTTHPSFEYEQDLNDPHDGTNPLATGIFLVHGKQRTLPPVKAMLYNTPLLSKKKNVFNLQVRSAHYNKPFRSTSSIDFMIEDCVKRSSQSGTVSVKLPFQSTSGFHVSILAHALGAPPAEFVALVKKMAGSAYDPVIFRQYEISITYNQSQQTLQTQEDAIMFISRLFGRAQLSTGMNVIRSELFPHINPISSDQEAQNAMKLVYLSRCVAQLILFKHDKIPPTKRDHFFHACVMSSADFVGQLFRLMFIAHMRTTGKLLRRALMQLVKKKNSQSKIQRIDLAKLFGEPRLSARLLSSVANGSWSANKKGVTISLNSNNKVKFMYVLQTYIHRQIYTDNDTYIQPPRT